MESVLTFLIMLLTILPIGWLLKVQITTAIGLKAWAKKLKRKDATQTEAEEALIFLKKSKWIPNNPKYWGCCKTIYHSVLVSNQVNFETKMAIFNRLHKLKCHGIVRPINRQQSRNA